MPLNFNDLKSNRSSTKELVEKLNKLSGAKQESSKDDRFWTPAVDKAGNGYSVIRFLPAPPNEDVPFVRIWDHGFQGPGGWYIENSLTTLGKADPVSERNSALWNSGVDADKEIARKQKRRLHFISNVYIIEDSLNPENNGQVRLFKYGKKIFDKLNEAMNPQFADEEPVNPFDFWEGANFKLKIRNVEGYRNYDKSEFASPSPLFKDDEKLESVWKSQHSLQEFLNPDNFKSYDELKTKLERVLGLSGDAGKRAVAAKTAEEDAPWNEQAPAPRQREVAVTPLSVDDDDDDASLDYFKKLAQR
jgi:hypothetical protein